MCRSRILSTGFQVPERVVANQELEAHMETSDEWIRKRSGIEERRWAEQGETGADLARGAAERALEAAGMEAGELDCIVLATLSPDHFFPGTGVFLQRELGVEGIPCLDVRTQCTGFLYGLSVADAWIRTGAFRRVLLVGTEIHSGMLELSDRGRDTAVLFGDGAGVAILGDADGPPVRPGALGNGDGTESSTGPNGTGPREPGSSANPTGGEGHEVLEIRLHADGRHAEKLWTEAPGMASRPFVSEGDIQEGRHLITMEGRQVFRHAVLRMAEAVEEVLSAAGYVMEDLDMVIPHQANLRISKAVQERLGLPPESVYNNVQRYGNTSAASIPIALHECAEEGRIGPGDLICLTAFGAGFTWAGALLRW